MVKIGCPPSIKGAELHHRDLLLDAGYTPVVQVVTLNPKSNRQSGIVVLPCFVLLLSDYTDTEAPCCFPETTNPACR